MRTELRIDDIDLSDPEFWTRPLHERNEAFALLRAERPIARFPEPAILSEIFHTAPGPGYFAVTRHADVYAISRSPEAFCSGRGATNIFDLPPEFLEFFGSMINLDDPRHLRLRRIVSKAFTPKRVEQINQHVRETAARIVDDVIERGECDFVTDIAAPLPLRIICELMGVPKADEAYVFERSNIILSEGDTEYIPEGADAAMAGLSAGNDLAQLMSAVAEDRARRPTDDLTSVLIHANVDGEQLTHQELVSFFILLVVAGNETTRNAISHGLLALTDHPDQRRIWAADLDAVTPTAVEEIVRWASPVIWMRRTATRDEVVGGHRFHEGDKVLLFYCSANRDETVFDEPERFDVRRRPNDHLGFGGFGPHYCLGAHLARQEIGVMFAELLRRIPDIRSAGEPRRLSSSFINGIKHLPCEFTPERRTL
jgi:methyl-branched lipid omega-hydroxylase